jgi:SAM-dependent methyltransferase
MSRPQAVTFQDHFSGHAADYARYRPQYPPALFAYLAQLAPSRELAWDTGTGNGQAALGLAAHFVRVIASDAAEQQIANAVPHVRVEYRVAPAESLDALAGSVDLITAAQAAHWFDLARFHAEARRVLKPQGVVAIWCYGLTRVAPEVDAIVEHFYRDVVGPFWPPELRFIDERYQTLPFPFTEEQPPTFRIETAWRLQDFKHYLRTWSATQRYTAQRGTDPLQPIEHRLAQAWGDVAQPRAVGWPIHLRVGRS